ncbi:F-box domain-containing protein [Favolaschia claudopus]|uniref:F-box domain-containing protein n=1 Tax=Favolaschia claudopus TaxID=2862362 RepID=A0AAW0C8E9_9AGAR
MCGMRDNSLPDELISEILSPALKVSDEVFSNTDHVSPFSSYGESTSAYLLVCKSWLRVATPLLYSVVVLRSKAQAKALANALSGNPELGRFIKKLRVEGGFGPPMHTILKSSPNVVDLFLALEIYSSDNTTGLCKGLNLINPSRFILQDFRHKPLENKVISQLLVALTQSLVKWNNLVVFDSPFHGHRTSAEKTLLPAITAKQLHTLVIPSISDATWAHSTFTSSSLKVIEVKKPVEHWQQYKIPKDPVVLSILKFTEELTPKVKKAQELSSEIPLIAPSLNPSYVPLASASKEVQDTLWARILYFAMPPRKLALLLVSKTFYRLALSHYYTHINVHYIDALSKISSVLKREPVLGPHIRTLSFTYYDWNDGFLADEKMSGEVASSRAETMLAIVSRTSNLVRFGDSNRFSLDESMLFHTYPSIDWDTFEALARCSGSSLRECSLSIETRKRVSPRVLESFASLRMLLWKSCTVFSAISDVSVDALPNLEELRIMSTDPSFLSVLSRLKLQALQRLIFADMELDDSGMKLREFFKTHGPKLHELCLPDNVLRDLGNKVFKLCPNMTTLSLSWHRFASVPPKMETLRPPEAAPSLEKIVFIGPYWDKGNHTLWHVFFADFKPGRLSSLREIQFMCFKWPTNERDIAKSDWVRWAEKLLKHGVSLSDKTGTKWRPRLKVR